MPSPDPPEDPPDQLILYFGGPLKPSELIGWPALGALPALAMIPSFPFWLDKCILGLSVLTISSLLWAASIAYTHERAWVGGSRLQGSLILGSFVLGQMLFFAAMYNMVSSTRGSFSEPLTPASAIYFSVTAWTTTGFGDIHPVSSSARLLVSVELLSAVGTVVIVLATAASKAFAKRD
jgi:hypothetical protein